MWSLSPSFHQMSCMVFSCQLEELLHVESLSFYESGLANLSNYRFSIVGLGEYLQMWIRLGNDLPFSHFLCLLVATIYDMLGVILQFGINRDIGEKKERGLHLALGLAKIGSIIVFGLTRNKAIDRLRCIPI